MKVLGEAGAQAIVDAIKNIQGGIVVAHTYSGILTISKTDVIKVTEGHMPLLNIIHVISRGAEISISAEIMGVDANLYHSWPSVDVYNDRYRGHIGWRLDGLQPEPIDENGNYNITLMRNQYATRSDIDEIYHSLAFESAHSSIYRMPGLITKNGDETTISGLIQYDGSGGVEYIERPVCIIANGWGDGRNAMIPATVKSMYDDNMHITKLNISYIYDGKLISWDVNTAGTDYWRPIFNYTETPIGGSSGGGGETYEEITADEVRAMLNA